MSEVFTVTVSPKDAAEDVVGRRVIESARRSQRAGFTRCSSQRLFYLRGSLTRDEVARLAERLLLDPVVQRLEVDSQGDQHGLVEVAFRPGVTDTEGENLLKAAHREGFSGLLEAATGWRYHLEGQFDQDELQDFACSLLANPVVQVVSVGRPLAPPFVERHAAAAEVETIALEGAGDEQLLKLSKDYLLALDLAEMKTIQAFYSEKGRDPTRCELETLAQTWSEHCVHKTFRAKISFDDNGDKQEVDGLLPLLRRTTESLNKDWVVSAFVDNAGVIKFHKQWNLAIKAETHNHPSALEPFGGANTGVGGVIRDILGVSARPIANIDALCFGSPSGKAPQGSLPPAQIIEGVVHGIADYGNKMGIPTVAGAVVFHPGYTANPLVYCGCLGIVAQGANPTEPQPGDHIVVMGGKTGRDGLGGATFSSLEMDTTTMETCGTAVQIGDPIQEKLAGDLLLLARDRKLYNAVTDCGAGGLASAVGEMGSELGAKVDLDKVPLKYPGLTPREIWLSEAQERMVLAVPEKSWQALQELAAEYDTCVVSIGHFQPTGKLELFYAGKLFGELDMKFLHKGIPRQHLQAVWTTPNIAEKPVKVDPGEALLALLADENICSREPILRRYDHEVQGQTAIKPVGWHNAPSDGVALVPLELQAEDDPPAAVLGCGIAPQLTELDPRVATWAAIDEAIRNAVVCGADPDRICLLDNFSWGNPRLPDRLGTLVKSCQACAEASLLYQAPFVSGKDSLNNEFVEADGSRRAIPGTLLITALGRLPRVSQRVTTELKGAGNLLYLLGPSGPELGGSAYLRVFGGSSAHLPQPYNEAPLLYRRYHQALQQGLVASAHDLSEGGLAVALAGMCLAGDRGARVDFAESLLFTEGPSRLLVEVRPEHEKRFLEAMQSSPLQKIGRTSEGDRLVVEGLIDLGLDEMRAAFERDLFECLGGSRQRGRHRDHTPVQVPAAVGSKVPVAVLWAPGTNREQDAVRAVEAAGGEARLVSLSGLSKGLKDHALVILPGGFSFGDDLGAGRLWALELLRLGETLSQFIEAGGAVLGICNGFQALVKADFLPGTLTHNHSDHFECRWVDLEVDPSSPCLFTKGLEGHIRCPVAHGEGRFVCDDEVFDALERGRGIPLRYAGVDYPANPNGSRDGIAAVCNESGNVMGLMPHPENHIYPWQNAGPARCENTGLALFSNALKNIRRL